jgi:hypothetical protein
MDEQSFGKYTFPFFRQAATGQETSRQAYEPLNSPGKGSLPFHWYML